MNQKATVMVDGIESRELSVTRGILQGDTLAPYLFIIVVDWMLKMLRATDGPSFKLTDSCKFSELAFADDIAQISESMEDAQAQLDRLQKIGKAVGLHINASKTEYMAANIVVAKSLGPSCREIGIFTPDPLIASDCVIHLPVYCNHFLFACQAVHHLVPDFWIFGYFRVFENP